MSFQEVWLTPGAAGNRRFRGVKSEGGMKADARRISRSDDRREDAFDDATVEVDLLVQAGAEPVNEGDRPDPCGGEENEAKFAHAAFHHGEENAQQRALQGRVALQEGAQPFGHRRHPLRRR